MTVVNAYDFTAKCYSGSGGYRKLWLVVHDMEAPELATTAEAVAEYFRTSAAKTSAHYCIDSDSIVQCVHLADRAWAAGTTGNRYGVHYEQAGYARQTAAEWADPFSQATIGNMARIMAEDALQLGIEVRTLTDAQVKAKTLTGIVTHAQLSRCFPAETTHTDPGPNFPMAQLLAAIRANITPPTPPTPKPPVPKPPAPKPPEDPVWNEPITVPKTLVPGWENGTYPACEVLTKTLAVGYEAARRSMAVQEQVAAQGKQIAGLVELVGQLVPPPVPPENPPADDGAPTAGGGTA